jgi:two-component system chemotaxis response regulator CheB
VAQPDVAHDLVVIGASAGGVEALREVVAGLPSDLPAAVCVVLHLAPRSPSALAQILRRAGSLPCHTAFDGQELKPGQIVVAPPDRHLVIDDDRVRLTVGPPESGHRPAVNVLFRSAAAQRGARVVGVVLSGTRDDGAAGLAMLKARGGAAIVQDPADALYAGMPSSALRHVAADVVAPCARIGAAVDRLVRARSLMPPQSVGANDRR